MAPKLIRLAHKIAIELHLGAESCTICSSLAPGGQSGNFWIHSHIRFGRSVASRIHTIMDSFCAFMRYCHRFGLRIASMHDNF